MSHLPASVLEDLPKLDEIDLSTRRRSRAGKAKRGGGLRGGFMGLDAIEESPQSAGRDVSLLPLPGFGGAGGAQGLKQHNSSIAPGAEGLLQAIMGESMTAAGAQFAGRVSPVNGNGSAGSGGAGAAAGGPANTTTIAVQAARKDVIALRENMHAMLARLGAANPHHEYPNEIRALLRLAEDEHTIFDSVFQEMVRQVTLHMIERGEILGELRKRYANMFAQIPRVVKGVYSELCAERVINRRLSNELLRTRDAMRTLGEHLAAIQRADTLVAEQGEGGRVGLLDALARSETVDATLTEYHNLYRMQRRRLEQSIRSIDLEKKVWVDAATHLALRIGSEHGLPDVAILQKYEYGRLRAVNHIISIMSTHYRTEVDGIERRIDEWMGELKTRAHGIDHEDNKCLSVLGRTLREIRTLQKSLEIDDTAEAPTDHRTSGGGGHAAGGTLNVPGAGGRPRGNSARGVRPTANPPVLPWEDPNMVPEPAEEVQTMDRARTLLMFETKSVQDMLKRWVDHINQVSTRYTSDRDEHIMDDLTGLQRSLEGWVALGGALLKKNEKSSSGKEYVELQNRLFHLKEELENWIARMRSRVSGDDGVASQVISLQNQLEDRYSLFSSRDNTRPLSNSERALLKESLSSWHDQISVLVAMMAASSSGDERRLPANVEAWLIKVSDQLANDSELRNEQNIKLHNSLVRWMVHLLIKSGRKAPDESWDDELHQLEKDLFGLCESLIQDSGDLELLSDDRKNLRLVVHSLMTAKRLLEAEKRTGVIQMQRRQSVLTGTGIGGLSGTSTPDARAPSTAASRRVSTAHGMELGSVAEGVDSDMPPGTAWTRGIASSMGSRELDVLTGTDSRRPSTLETPFSNVGGGSGGLDDDRATPRYPVLAQTPGANLGIPGEGGAGRRPSSAAAAAVSHALETMANLDLEDEEVLEFDSHYLDAGRNGMGSYPDVSDVPATPFEQTSRHQTNIAATGGMAAAAGSGSGATPGEPVWGVASPTRTSSRRGSVMGNR
ncbi:hypothetical protein H9P43_002415 [Blastocladiella emersonii ATCC 22665]|nr:hypothetical protein H9P43_002415 [Blastocladiella emersonii ATCC 22665]